MNRIYFALVPRHCSRIRIQKWELCFAYSFFICYNKVQDGYACTKIGSLNKYSGDCWFPKKIMLLLYVAW